MSGGPNLKHETFETPHDNVVDTKTQGNMIVEIFLLLLKI